MIVAKIGAGSSEFIVLSNVAYIIVPALITDPNEEALATPPGLTPAFLDIL